MTFLTASNNSPVARYIVTLVYTWLNGEAQQNVFGFDTIKEVRECLVLNSQIDARGGCTIRDCVSNDYTIKNLPAAMVKATCYRRGSYLAYRSTLGGFCTVATVTMQ